MFSKTKRSLLGTDRRRVLFIGMLTATIASSLVLVNSVQWEWGNMVAGVCITYAVLSTFFLAAQMVGFVVSQTNYSESVEEPKFTMIENEEAEWAHLSAK